MSALFDAEKEVYLPANRTVVSGYSSAMGLSSEPPKTDMTELLLSYSVTMACNLSRTLDGNNDETISLDRCADARICFRCLINLR
jgi:hypothetical protein